MSAVVSRLRSMFRFAVLGSAAFAAPALAVEQVAVQLDQARLMKLPDGVATLVVGNPAIADVSLQPGNLAVVTGKGFGTTNVVALDHAGAVVLDRQVQVQGASDQIVTVYRGVAQETYSCTPVCQKRVTLGDAPDYFEATLKQIDSRNAQALGKGDTGYQVPSGSQAK